MLQIRVKTVKTAIAYTRVSTASQGRSGLGLEAQQAAIARFAEAEGFDLIETFIEIETGKGADALDRRPQLTDALRPRPGSTRRRSSSRSSTVFVATSTSSPA